MLLLEYRQCGTAEPTSWMQAHPTLSSANIHTTVFRSAISGPRFAFANIKHLRVTHMTSRLYHLTRCTSDGSTANIDERIAATSHLRRNSPRAGDHGRS